MDIGLLWDITSTYYDADSKLWLRYTRSAHQLSPKLGAHIQEAAAARTYADGLPATKDK
jgi:hypothetical protein